MPQQSWFRQSAGGAEAHACGSVPSSRPRCGPSASPSTRASASAMLCLWSKTSSRPSPLYRAPRGLTTRAPFSGQGDDSVASEAFIEESVDRAAASSASKSDERFVQPFSDRREIICEDLRASSRPAPAAVSFETVLVAFRSRDAHARARGSRDGGARARRPRRRACGDAWGDETARAAARPRRVSRRDPRRRRTPARIVSERERDAVARDEAGPRSTRHHPRTRRARSRSARRPWRASRPRTPRPPRSSCFSSPSWSSPSFDSLAFPDLASVQLDPRLARFR